MNITIVGAGNVGTQLAVHCAKKGHDVIVYGSKPDKVHLNLSIINEFDEVIHRGTIKKATSNEREAFEKAEIIFVTTPASMMQIIATKITPFANTHMKICLVPGTGGGECAFKECIEKGIVLFAVQRVPSVARLVEYGSVVRAIGYREEMLIAAIPNEHTKECCGIIHDLLDMKASPLPNFLNITLTPSNAIIHPTRLKNLFGEWKDGVVYSRNPLFYEEWNDETSKLLIACDNEVQQICAKLNMFDLSYVKSLRNHYESQTVEAMTKKISSIRGFMGLKSPCVEVENGYIPDFNSRYFTSDFSFGLVILIQFAEYVGSSAVNMKETQKWYYELVGNKNEFKFSDYGINNLDDLVEFYSR